ncbi:MAG: 50S ribosomal protein L13 [Spirochaetota bacterium]
MRTLYVNEKQIERKWYLIDADGVTLGRLATKVATILRGKHKPYFTPRQELGDYVVIVNAERVNVTGRKRRQKMYYKHSGYPGALRAETFQSMIKRKPEYPIEHAVRGMLPRNRLGRKLFKNVKVYAGPNHPHQAQQPEKLEIKE